MSPNSELAQILLEQASGAASRSLQEQVESLISKERESASKPQALEEIHNMRQWPLLRNSNASQKKCNLDSQPP